MATTSEVLDPGGRKNTVPDVVVHDNGQLFWVEGSNMALARFCAPADWARLTPEWKLDAMALCCEAMACWQPKPMDRRYMKVAPLFVHCQQQDIHAIREGIPGHGSQRVTSVYRRGGVYIRLECGCNLPITWLPAWEQAAIHEYERLVVGQLVEE